MTQQTPETDTPWRNGKTHPTGGYDKRIVARGDTLYFVAAYLHRLDGPAVEADDGSVQFWIRGQRFTQDEWAARAAQLRGPS